MTPKALLKVFIKVEPGTVERWALDGDGKATFLDSANIERQHLNPAPSWDPSLQADDLLETL